jgi:Phage protein (N4 Gp49/phage Sf6 gene 66) family
MSIKADDEAAAAVAKAPRVTLADVQEAILRVDYTTASKAIGQDKPPYTVMTLAFVLMHNGYLVIGKSAPAAPENFNESLGMKLAYEDAVRQIWPLMGYCLREKLAMEGT